MNYDQAKSIAAEITPELVVDPMNRDLPMMLVVRAKAGGAPFSIALSNGMVDDARDPAEIESSSRAILVDSLNAAKKNFGL